MNVLSLFDGMSCGQIALNELGIKVDNYFASEIKPHAIKVTQTNFPKTIQLGDVCKIKAGDLPRIDLLIGGSPCQDFSRGNNIRDGLKGTKSKLFYEYLRLLNELNPKNYLLENVIMEDFGYMAISEHLKTEPVRINGSKTSAALRDRLYWTNIGPECFDLFGNRKCNIPQPKDKNIKLQNILEYGYTDKIKHSCLNTWYARTGGDPEYWNRRNETTGMVTLIYDSPDFDYKKGIRLVNQNELEVLHNIPKGFTSMVSRNHAADLIGDGWTVGIIKHIFSFI